MVSFSGFSASVIGSSHLARDEEKQDSVTLASEDDRSLAFCLSDGAGSSKKSQMSSKITANFVARELSGLPLKIQTKGVGPWINDYIIQIVINLREIFYSEFQTYDLRDFHCTLVAGVVFDGNCLIAQIGDGAVLVGRTAKTEDVTILNDRLTFSEPENGEYINETYFVTEPNWLKHLRIQVIPDMDWLIAGTDGGIDLLSYGNRLQDILIFDCLRDLIAHSPDQRERRLHDVLSSDLANEKTNDDKSISIIFSNKLSEDVKTSWDDSLDSCANLYFSPSDTNLKDPVEINESSEQINLSNEEPSSFRQNIWLRLRFSQKLLHKESVLISIGSLFLIIFFYIVIMMFINQQNSLKSVPAIPESNQIQKSSEIDLKNSSHLEPATEDNWDSKEILPKQVLNTDDNSRADQEEAEHFNSSSPENIDLLNNNVIPIELLDNNVIPIEDETVDDVVD